VLLQQIDEGSPGARGPQSGEGGRGWNL
jgi:hypothetical protein